MKFTSLPTSASLRSHWLADALRVDDDLSPSLRAPVHADVCVVGGGYTGLWTAIELKQRDPGCAVVLVEASRCGSGASGTNAGYLMNLWPKYPSLAAQFGRDEAITLATATSDAVEDIVAFCREHDIDASIKRTGYLWTATADNQLGAWQDTLATLDGVPGSSLREVTAARAAELAGPRARGGVLDDTSATVQPAKLARGLRRVALRLGVEIHERTPVVQIDSGHPIEVRTGATTLTADSVVLAVNAWAMALPSVRKHMVLTASDNLVTEPLSETGELIGLGAGTSDSRRQLNYWRRTPDSRLLFGKGGIGVGYGDRGASSMFGPVPQTSAVRAHFERTFPELSSAKTANWRAPVEYSLTSLPFFGEVPDLPRVFFGTGYSGDGVGPSRVGGRILASLATNTVDEWSTCALTRPPGGWLPPEPIRFLGGQAIRLALQRIDDASDTGRRVHPATRALARFDPTTWL